MNISKIGDSSDEYELEIRCFLEGSGHKKIDEFLEKRNLMMREENGSVIISANSALILV